MKINNIFPVLLLASLTPTLSIGKTGSELKTQCDARQSSKNARVATENAYSAGVCDGYIGGVGDATNGLVFCPPDNLDKAQGVAVVMKYLAAHPEEAQTSADVVIGKALSQAYPCAPQKNPQPNQVNPWKF